METIERHNHESRTLLYTRHKRFKDGWSDDPIGEERGTCRPTKRDVKLIIRVMDVIREDSRLTVRDVKLWIGKLSVQRILSGLSMTRVCARWVPRLLNKIKCNLEILFQRTF